MKIFRTADAFRARQREGPHDLIKNDYRPLIGRRGLAAMAASKKRLSRDFWARSIFDFCNSIRHKQPFHNHSFGESQNNQPIADDQSMLRRLFLVWPISSAAAFCRTAEAPQHSMLAVMMEQEFHFSLSGLSANLQRTGILRGRPKLKRAGNNQHRAGL